MYQNFLNQIDDKNKFYYSFIQIFTDKIKDPNLLVKFLELKLYHIDLDEYENEDIKSFIDFLQIVYTDKQILNLFSELNYDATNETMFFDMVREFDYCKDILFKNFKKQKIGIKELHDEFVKISREKRYKNMYESKLNYKKIKSKACIDIKGYQIKLPQNGKELLQWADILHNCMAGYFDMIQKDETIIYGFFKDSILKFAVEIDDGSLIQASGKYNSQLENEEQEILTMSKIPV